MNVAELLGVKDCGYSTPLSADWSKKHLHPKLIQALSFCTERLKSPQSFLDLLLGLNVSDVLVPLQ